MPVKKKGATEAQLSISVPTLITALGLMVTIMLAIAGGVAGLYQSIFIPAAKSELEVKLDNLKSQSQDEMKLREAKLNALQLQVKELEKARNNLLEAGASPILNSPKNDEIIISNQITFRWDYKADQIPHFIIEITRVLKGSLNRSTYSVLQPSNRLFHLPIVSDAETGEYLWRVRPGVISEDREIATGPWSAYQSFSVFTSIKQKIAHTRRVTVGMYRSFTDKFNLPVAGGKYEGLSAELARFLADELSARMLDDAGVNRRIKVEIVSYAWQDLLTELSKNSVDMVISSVTATKKREQQFGILFSKGYFVTHSMLLSNQLSYNQSISLFANLKDKRLGALKESTNEKAALFLQKRCDCGITVNANYLELIESKSGLFKHEVDLLLTDDIWPTGQANIATFNRFGPPLDGVLQEFYADEYGRPSDEYAVAVPRNGGNELLALIDDILGSQKAQEFLADAQARARVLLASDLQ